MAWENFSLKEQRKLMAEACLSGQKITHVCRAHGISRTTAYKWLHRHAESGDDGLVDQSRARHNLGIIYSEEQMALAVDYKLRHRDWGPKKILIKLKEIYPHLQWPCATTLYEKFKELHLVASRKVRRRVPGTAPLGNHLVCNDVWAIDLKGYFKTGDNRRCEPLTITDCVSRYLIQCTHLERHTVDYVWPVLDQAFREYGLPRRIRSDNGPPFGSTGVGRLTLLSVNLIKAGVVPEWIRPGHPEDNGRHERLHLTLKQAIASPPKGTLALQLQAMADFQDEYNFDRPHEALDFKTPGSCHQRSARNWDGILRPPEYDRNEADVRKVGQSGCTLSGLP